MLKILCSDFYRPWRLPALHEELFPERFYSVDTSPRVMHQALMRTREWLSSEKLPIDLLYSESGYRLKGRKSYVFKISGPAAPVESAVVGTIAKRIEKHFGKKAFTTIELAELLGCSDRNARRALADIRKQGLLVERREGSRVFYSLLSQA
jgi:hypothetical protein